MKEWHKLQMLCESLHCRVQMAESLRNHTTFRIGGACAAFVNVNCIEILQEILVFCRDQEIPYTVMGNGSNILVADSGYPGIVLHLGRDFSAIAQEGNRLCCQAGATLSSVGRLALEQSLTGMECLAGIPGTIGGALYMNAGAYGGEMANVVVSARCMQPNGTICELKKEQMQLGYRKSIFRNNEWIILDVTLELKQGSYGAIKTEMNTLMTKRRAKQPLELPSAGSTFQRPMGNYASFLIDQCGLKGASVGDAQVSMKHAGFVVNTGKATCHDVLELCRFVQQTVQEKTGYWLELEPVILGEQK